MQRRALAIAMFAISACGAAQVPPVQHVAKSVEPYRPDWTAAIPLQIDEIRACLRERQPPTVVVHVQSLSTGATGVTAVDGMGHIEDCAVASGEVLLREPSALEPEDLEGLPVFSPETEPPAIASGILLEQIEDDDVVLGWLYWPSARGR